MEPEPKLQPEQETLVAPGEVRELISRLTDKQIDGVDLTSVGSVQGLATRTGIPVEQLRRVLEDIRGVKARRVRAWIVAGVAAVMMIGVTALVLQGLSGPKPDFRGLQDGAKIAYADAYSPWRVDPVFTPKHPLPDGAGMSAGVNGVLWGAGDLRSRHEPKLLNDAEANAFRENLIALLRTARERASARHLETMRPQETERSLLFEVRASLAGPVWSHEWVTVWPIETRDAESEKAIETAADRLTKSVIAQAKAHVAERSGG